MVMGEGGWECQGGILTQEQERSEVRKSEKNAGQPGHPLGNLPSAAKTIYPLSHSHSHLYVQLKVLALQLLKSIA